MRRITDAQFAEWVDGEVTARISEFNALVRALEKIQKKQFSLVLKNRVIFLYSHWEGAIKEISIRYVKHLNNKKLTYRQLAPSLLGFAFKSKLSEFEITNKAELHNRFVTFLSEELDGRVRFSEDLISTESNLNKEVLDNISYRLGLSERFRNSYSLRKPFIDGQLLAARNHFAHGGKEEDQFELDTLKNLRKLENYIFGLMRDFGTEVSNIVISRHYLKCDQPFNPL